LSRGRVPFGAEARRKYARCSRAHAIHTALMRARVHLRAHASAHAYARSNYLVDIVQVEVWYARRVTQVLQSPRAAMTNARIRELREKLILARANCKANCRRGGKSVSRRVRDACFTRLFIRVSPPSLPPPPLIPLECKILLSSSARFVIRMDHCFADKQRARSPLRRKLTAK
jgi:hypothetical protein